MIKRNLIIITLTVIFSIIIAFLIYKKFIYPTVIPVEMNGLVYIFADWAAIVSANVCEQKGVNVYLENPCDIKNRNMYTEKFYYIYHLWNLINLTNFIFHLF